MLALALCVLFGCTITPKTVKHAAPSYDGGRRDSGWRGFYTNHHGAEFAVISAHARDRYNALIGLGLSPSVVALTNDQGVTQFTNGTYIITLEALRDFGLMNDSLAAKPKSP